MHTVVPGWFGLSAVWFIPLIWRLVKSVLPGGAGLRGPGTIRLWLGFVCVLLASCTLEATLLHIEGFDALGHALANGLGKLLGHTAAPLVMTALLFVSLPWLIDFRWRNFFAWADDSLGLGLNIRPARPSSNDDDGERPGRRASRQDAAQPQGASRSGLAGLGSLGKLASGLGSSLGIGSGGLGSGTGPSAGSGGGTAESLDGTRRKRPTVWRPQMPGKRAASAAGMGAAGATASAAAQSTERAYAAHGTTRSGTTPWRAEPDFASPEPSPAAAWARTEPTAPAGWLRDGQPAARTPMPAAPGPNAQPADAWRNPAAGLNGVPLPPSTGASRAGVPADARSAPAMGANGAPTPSTPSTPSTPPSSFPADTRRQPIGGIGGGAAAGMAASAVAGAHAGTALGGAASGGAALAGAAGSPAPWRAAPARPATTPAAAPLSSPFSSPVSSPMSPSLSPMSASTVRPAAASAAHAAALASTAAVTPRGSSAPRDPLVSPFAQPAPVRRSAPPPVAGSTAARAAAAAAPQARQQKPQRPFVWPTKSTPTTAQRTPGTRFGTQFGASATAPLTDTNQVTPAYSRPTHGAASAPQAPLSTSVLETLRSIEENAARWTTLAGASLARRNSVDQPAALTDVPAHAGAAAAPDNASTLPAHAQFPLNAPQIARPPETAALDQAAPADAAGEDSGVASAAASDAAPAQFAQEPTSVRNDASLASPPATQQAESVFAPITPDFPMAAVTPLDTSESGEPWTYADDASTPIALPSFLIDTQEDDAPPAAVASAPAFAAPAAADRTPAEIAPVATVTPVAPVALAATVTPRAATPPAEPPASSPITWPSFDQGMPWVLLDDEPDAAEPAIKAPDEAAATTEQTPHVAALTKPESIVATSAGQSPATPRHDDAATITHVPRWELSPRVADIPAPEDIAETHAVQSPVPPRHDDAATVTHVPRWEPSPHLTDLPAPEHIAETHAAQSPALPQQDDAATVAHEPPPPVAALDASEPESAENVIRFPRIATEPLHVARSTPADASATVQDPPESAAQPDEAPLDHDAPTLTPHASAFTPAPLVEVPSFLSAVPSATQPTPVAPASFAPWSKPEEPWQPSAATPNASTATPASAAVGPASAPAATTTQAPGHTPGATSFVAPATGAEPQSAAPVTTTTHEATAAEAHASISAGGHISATPPWAQPQPAVTTTATQPPAAPVAHDNSAQTAPDTPQPEAAPRQPVRGHAPTSFEFQPLTASAVELPGLDLLERASSEIEPVSEQRLAETSQLIEQRLQEFKVPVTVVGASAGPVITRFEVEPALGVRGSQIVGLMKDLSRGLGLTSIRVVETIPGKTCMGLELPNARRQMIRLSEILESAPYHRSQSKLTIAMGKDIVGHPIVTDLAKAPHMLVAGTTGSGKSVAINAMILSLLYKATPEDVRLIMIDPKMLELSVYEGIPHLLAPVVTDMKLAANALNWCVGEMEKRYRLMSAVGVRNLAGFNQKIRDAAAHEKKIGNPFSLTPEAPEPLSPLPMIVVVIDELADLMMVAGKKIEELIARLAQKARAAGIHLILATQRPSVDVITGLIKANIPTRVAFQVSSKIDSRTILDQMGAESLLGQGDMLFLPPGTGYPQRVHGAFVADEEVHAVVEYLKQFGEPEYIEGILDGPAGEGAPQDLFGDSPDAEADPLYDEAVAFVVRTRRASISSVQRQLRIGYNRAARLVEQMEAAGLVSPMGINGSREVLVPGQPE
ncbi:DNA translocase FtsK [Paraburkholderia pallida]|uniref:FtsK domain-containing protein n=1 Tax=Paraburkholderia pallida TaxID=2547399 RepID=A0A4P7CVJ9_9BURK|nr:DNA translocase FtsK [Paraburkholderia pallida]QBQ98111.1 hypothetical protein E1956_13655 [Paraburkholderia pallida]